MKRFKIGALLVVVVGLMVVSGWYYFKMQNELLASHNQIRKLRHEVESEKELAFQKLDSIKLHLISEPFTWALRKELLNDNVLEIHHYLNQFVKHEQVKLLAVVGIDGEIISCTNKKKEGQNFRSAFPDQTFSAGLSIVSIGSQQVAFHPIMGFDRQLGTLFIIYQFDSDLAVGRTSAQSYQ